VCALRSFSIFSVRVCLAQGPDRWIRFVVAPALRPDELAARGGESDGGSDGGLHARSRRRDTDGAARAKDEDEFEHESESESSGSHSSHGAASPPAAAATSASAGTATAPAAADHAHPPSTSPPPATPSSPQPASDRGVAAAHFDGDGEGDGGDDESAGPSYFGRPTSNVTSPFPPSFRGPIWTGAVDRVRQIVLIEVSHSLAFTMAHQHPGMAIPPPRQPTIVTVNERGELHNNNNLRGVDDGGTHAAEDEIYMMTINDPRHETGRDQRTQPRTDALARTHGHPTH
jgi:hypothetical protein